MDKKSIVLLIVSIIIFVLALIFAIWSFKVDLSVQNNQIGNQEQSQNNYEENIKNTVNEEVIGNEILDEESKTKDFAASYMDFSIEGNEGNQIKLSDYKDQPVMIVFFDEENEDSLEMLKRINTQYENYKDRINFIAISTREQQSNPNTQEIQIPIYYDNNQEITKMYNIVELPTMLYINKENEVFNSKTGLTSEDALKANLDILSENF